VAGRGELPRCSCETISPVRTALALVLAFLLSGHAAAAVPNDAAIRKILVDRIDVREQGVGLVVGVIEPSGRRIVSHGTYDRDKRQVNGDTLFEIGSATKVFTALLLADSVQRNEVELTDPVAKFLPADVKMPSRGGKEITLQDLATHTSGLPRLPENLAPEDVRNPYADYEPQQLYDFLSSYTLPRDPGASYEYSNLGAGLLGHALARRAKTDYETLVRTRILTPLAMKSTAIALREPLQRRLAPGHDEQRHVVPNWDLATLAGAGGLRSTANDLLLFLAAAMRQTPTTLAPAMTSLLSVRRPTPAPNMQIALGWHVHQLADGRELVWHNGGTGGYRSFMGYEPKSGTGIVVLSNIAMPAVDDIGMHLLDPSTPLSAAPEKLSVTTVDPAILEQYVGIYELAPSFAIRITHENGRLWSQATGQPRVELFAASEKKFFLQQANAQITFETGMGGRATALTLHQNGTHRAPRVESHAFAPKDRQAVFLDAAVFDRYIGRYQLTPSFIMTISREGDRLFLQATNQPKFELFAENERHFFLREVDAQVTFVPDAAGRATSLILHQNGADRPAKRVE